MHVQYKRTGKSPLIYDKNEIELKKKSKGAE